jgi:AcrR family transcriptional regulator
VSTRRGRRPGDPAVTRRAIVEAARKVFAEHGYERATIRAIAAAAGVDPALVHHHFGAKQELFVAAHDLPISPATIEAVLAGDEGTLGERLVRAYLTAAISERTPLEALVRSAVSNPTARDMLREFFENEILHRFADRVARPDARMRMALAGSQLIGLFMMRRILELDPIRTADVEDLVAAVAPTLDRYLGADEAA